jgi:hypothetical protein
MKALHIILLALMLSLFAGCASKTKSSARVYEGDSSPFLKFHEENPGGPLGR